MNMDPEFDNKILSLIAEAVPGKFRKVKLTKETRLQSELGLDSLALAALVGGVTMSGLRTVNDAINASHEIVKRARAAKNS